MYAEALAATEPDYDVPKLPGPEDYGVDPDSIPDKHKP